MMKRALVATLVVALGLLFPLVALASPIKTFVKDFTVSAPGSENMKGTLKTLLASRLRGDGIEVVDSESEADVVISPSYTQIGKMFSLDAVARTAPGRQLATAFEQGDNPDTVIASVGKLAEKIREELVKSYPAKPAPPAASAVAPAPQPVSPAPVAAAQLQFPRATWSSPRLAGAQTALAPAGADQFLTVQGQSIILYHKDAKFTILARTEVSSRLKIVALDTIPAPEGGVLAFVSAIDNDEASSSVYGVTPGGFKLLANKLPYLFRTVSLNGGSKELFAQQLASGAQYFGNVYQASFVNGDLKLGKALKLPGYANIFNFNTFRDRAGSTYTIAFTDTGYLTVISDAGKELWRSEDKFGGSESFIMGHDPEYERFFANGDKPRFLDQRISITERGEIVVPQNAGFLVVGNMRSYSKYSMVALSWNGSALEELWRTKQTQGYLADYLLEPGSREMVVLEVTQKEGIFGNGASALRGIPVQ